MAIRDRVEVGVSLPHRSQRSVGRDDVLHVACRAEQLGFRSLWVTENTLSAPPRDFCFDPIALLSYVATATETIQLGIAVVVLPTRNPIHTAHQIATLDYLSGGRVKLAVGIGRAFNYAQFQVPTERRVKRFLEGVDVLRALWNEDQVSYNGDIYVLDNVGMLPKPLQQPLPIWFGGTHPNAVKRAAMRADGWIGSGGQSLDQFQKSVTQLHQVLDSAGRDPASFPVSKRVFVAVDNNENTARAQLDHWFGDPAKTAASGVFGTPERVRERLEDLVDMGANHLLLNMVSEYPSQLEALAEIVTTP